MTAERPDTRRQANVSQVDAPTAPGSAVAVSAADLIPAQLLDGGEIIVFAAKPSLWFIPIKSLKWLCAALLISGVANVQQFAEYRYYIVNTAIAVAFFRMLICTFDWTSRFYVLTNRRVMRLSGIARVQVFECPLHRIQHTELNMSPSERMTRTGTIHISTAGDGGGFTRWSVVAQPLEVHEMLRTAILKARNRGGNSA